MYTKIVNFKDYVKQSLGIMVIVALVSVAAFGVILLKPNNARAYSLIGSQMWLGSTGGDVSSLQSFLATNYLIYPEGMVTGYYGPLTAKAVTQFQIAYNLPGVGNVGPLTLAKINEVIPAGNGLDIASPQITGLTVNSLSSNGATISFQTSENARAKVFYATAPLAEFDTSMSQTEPTIGGTVWSDASFNTSKQVVLNGLSSNTTYFFVVEVIDASGNVRVTDQGTFHTS